MTFALDIQSVIGKRTGVGMYTLNIAREMARAVSTDENSELMFFYFDFFRRKGSSGLTGENASEFPIRVLPGRAYSLLWRLGVAPGIDSLVPEADLFHFPNFAIPPLRKGKKVVTIHDLAYMRFPMTIERKNLGFLRKRVPEAIRKADAVIAVSKFTRDELIELYGADDSRIQVIHEGVDARFTKIRDAEKLGNVRKKYRLPERFVLSVATVEPRKNIEGLLRAWEIFRKDPAGKDLGLVIAGQKGWGVDELFKRVNDTGLSESVLFTGYIADDELPALYSLAEVFVFVPLYEGFGLPALEALACGCSAVCSRIPPIEEVCGECVLTADPNCPEEISSCLLRLVNSPGERERLSKQGRARAKLFTWQAAAQKTLSLYRSLCP